MYNGLPEACLTLMPSDGRLIYIERGQSGYHTSNWDTGDPAQNRRIADNYNQRQGVTRAQEEAMLNGSLYSWDAPAADPKRYAIELEIGENSQNTIVEGDEELLKRAVANLIDNSIKHNPGGCAIKVSLSRDGTVCTISVSDNGTGFQQDVLNNLKAPQSSTELQNHGLGLTIVRQIIKNHHGTTEFQNLPQGGCEVMLSLPVLANE